MFILSIIWFLATFGDLGWGKASMLTAEGRRKEEGKIPTIEALLGL